MTSVLGAGTPGSVYSTLYVAVDCARDGSPAQKASEPADCRPAILQEKQALVFLQDGERGCELLVRPGKDPHRFHQDRLSLRQGGRLYRLRLDHGQRRQYFLFPGRALTGELFFKDFIREGRVPRLARHPLREAPAYGAQRLLLPHARVRRSKRNLDKRLAPQLRLPGFTMERDQFRDHPADLVDGFYGLDVTVLEDLGGHRVCSHAHFHEYAGECARGGARGGFAELQPVDECHEGRDLLEPDEGERTEVEAGFFGQEFELTPECRQAVAHFIGVFEIRERVILGNDDFRERLLIIVRILPEQALTDEHGHCAVEERLIREEGILQPLYLRFREPF